jgi:hypothetical protein
MNDNMTRYVALAHAIQSGVAMDLQHDPTPGTPKHLRTGLDCRAADHGALARLLIAKGVFTLEEYEAALLEGLEREKAAYEQRLTDRFGGGTKIDLA